MKIQHLAVIFIIIIMPLIIVFSEFINTQMTIVKTEEVYDTRLLNATYDAIKSFQLNTINSSMYIPQTRVQFIENAVNTFYNSLITSFNYTGNQKEVMREFVPAVVFTLYDGYYIYSPFKNTLTGVDLETVDKEYKKADNNDGKVIDGLKPYISYTCRYKDPKGDTNKTYIITYSMDNYISVEVFDGNKNERHEGYLVSGITKNGSNKYVYDNITFSQDAKEKMYEFLGDKRYPYVLDNGTKYYYDEENKSFFYFNIQGQRESQAYKEGSNQYSKLLPMLDNNYAYNYYKEAYDFTKWVHDNLSELSTTDIITSLNYDNYEFESVDKIFDDNIQYSNSNFNRHRADVIRAVITTNLSKAINGFGNYSSASGVQFLMPKISETDWELLENNICIATFMQGMNVGDKTYNNYAVVPNNFTKEYVDENDIYLLKNDNTYVRANDSTLNKDNIEKNLEFQPGVLKINTEKRKDIDGKYYNPLSKDKDNPYLQSYTSIAGTSKVNNLETIDMYRYIELTDNLVKKAYYTALGREREGSFKVSK